MAGPEASQRKQILTLNVGSNSLRFEVVRMEQSAAWGETLLAGMIEGIGRQATLSLKRGEQVLTGKQTIEAMDHQAATDAVLQTLDQQDLRSSITAVAHRVVHGGPHFDRPEFVDDQVIAAVEQLEEMAPLHNRGALAVMKALRQVMGDQPQVAVFDTVFHRTLPVAAKTYAIPYDLAQRLRIERYGFHGTSHEYMLLRYCELTGIARDQANLVTMHLESGSSVCAIQAGRSVETSMGFTPLEGLVMGTRSGDLDPAIVSFLCKKEHQSVEQIDTLLNKESGLLGLSGRSLDTRELVPHVNTDQRAKLAIDVFCHRLTKYVGAYLAVLGGAQAIVFGAGISENTPLVRERVCRQLQWCGLELDEAANERTINRAGRISTATSNLHAYVIPVSESLMLARKTAERLASGH